MQFSQPWYTWNDFIKFGKYGQFNMWKRCLWFSRVFWNLYLVETKAQCFHVMQSTETVKIHPSDWNLLKNFQVSILSQNTLYGIPYCLVFSNIKGTQIFSFMPWLIWGEKLIMFYHPTQVKVVLQINVVHTNLHLSIENHSRISG